MIILLFYLLDYDNIYSIKYERSNRSPEEEITMRKAFVLLVLICLLLCSCGGTVSREAYEKVLALRKEQAGKTERGGE